MTKREPKTRPPVCYLCQQEIAGYVIDGRMVKCDPDGNPHQCPVERVERRRREVDL